MNKKVKLRSTSKEKIVAIPSSYIQLLGWENLTNISLELDIKKNAIIIKKIKEDI